MSQMNTIDRKDRQKEKGGKLGTARGRIWNFRTPPKELRRGGGGGGGGGQGGAGLRALVSGMCNDIIPHLNKSRARAEWSSYKTYYVLIINKYIH